MMLMMTIYALLGTMNNVHVVTCALDHMTLPALVAWSPASLRSELHDSFGLEEWSAAPAWNNSNTCTASAAQKVSVLKSDQAKELNLRT